MNGDTFSCGDRVRVLTGKYFGFIGSVIDPVSDSEMLPHPRAGHHWIRIILQSFSIPVHVHQDDIQRESDCQVAVSSKGETE
jgi:hypothetical protein